MSAERAHGRELVLVPPSVEHPFWRSVDGKRISFGEAICGRDTETIAELGARQVQAIIALMNAGLMAARAEDHARARVLITSASRLCMEATGQFPGTAVRADE